jgi:molybdopterin-guanine dinucleotide biosynthesis adapter protein
MRTNGCPVIASASEAIQGGRKELDYQARSPVPENAMKVIGLAGWSGAGKTTLLTRVIPHLLGEGLRVSVIKHAHHKFDIDVPGKDSWRHRQAGATEVMVASGQRWALMHELRGEREPRLTDLLAKMSRVDLVVVEGYKSEPHRKIEVYRAANGKPFLFPDDPGIVGIATDTMIETRLPTAHLDNIPAIAELMRRSAISIEDVLAKRDIKKDVKREAKSRVKSTTKSDAES